MIDSSLPDGHRFLRYIFQALRFGFESHGVDYEPAIKKIGKDIGASISSNFKSESLEELLDEITVFWSKNGLGNVKIDDTNPPVIIVDNCFECHSMPNMDKKLCSFSAGLLEGIIAGNTGIECIIEETKCCGNGYDHCTYKMVKQTS
ncbi:MAG: V4R domain-containing protein [Methanohalobium sp.]|uniref:V4R domain-containing protein n=1 Tax=Methanohalobium sp. TaxID=2837493 RepID=UPI00397E268E